MKLKFFKRTLVIAFTLIATTQVSFAALSVDETHKAAGVALETFSEENPDHVEHFTGYKVWKSGDDAKVKIYISHDGMNMEFTYTCMKHETAFACHTQ